MSRGNAIETSVTQSDRTSKFMPSAIHNVPSEATATDQIPCLHSLNP